MCEFAHLIGLNVESYRIKETYKTAVERYLSTIKEYGNPVWNGSPWGLVKDREGLLVASSPQMKMSTVYLSNDEWADNGMQWEASYYFLRLDLNPDYQVDGEGA